MSKIPTTLSALLILALVAQGCGSDTTKTETDTAAADTAGADSTGDTATSDGSGDDATVDSTTGDDATEDTATGKTHKTCPSLGDCVLAACAPKAFEAGCQDACLADAEEGALLPAAGLLSCVQKTCLPACKDSKDPACLSDCMGESCTSDLVACITHGATPAGSVTCMETIGCFDGCGIGKSTSPFTCMSGCVAKTDAAGLKALDDVAKCQADANKDGKDADEVCAPAFLGCAISGKSGDKTCYDVFACQAECAKSGKQDDECMAICLPQLSKAAQQEFLDALPCFESKDAACMPKVLKCINPSGDKTCFESMACIDGCKADDGNSGACIFGCLHNVKATSSEALLATIAACDGGQDSGGGGGEPLPGDATPTGSDGPSKECMGALVTCIDPPATGLSCSELVQCFEACDKADPKVNTCPFDCISKGAKADVAQVVEFMSCNSDCSAECKDSKDEACQFKCLTTKCPEVVAKCVTAG